MKKTAIPLSFCFVILFILSILISCFGSPAAGYTSEREMLIKRSQPAPNEPQMVQAEVNDGTSFNTEDYDRIYENPFLETIKNPQSTFSIDVDTASYANIRRFLMQGQMPYKDAVRIEEMVNYFTYDYPEPKGNEPFSFSTETAVCPWNEENLLLRIGMQTRRLSFESLPPNNLVFLLDVSGSMNYGNKLPLLKQAIKLLVDRLRQQDTVSIVVYAGAAGLILPPTSGGDKIKILAALEELQAGGSTAGGAGIQLAYKVAAEHFNKNGNNRVILASDGDFNVGPSSEGELTRLIEEHRNKGIYLTVLGFGMGNFKDSNMENLADKGNGNYAYIDTIAEARKVLVTEMGATLLTIAKDVKIQIEFNPALIHAYRLIGYENRLLAAEDFADDTKDAGELGAGHAVTVFYELKPAGQAQAGSEDDLKYVDTTVKDEAYKSNEMMFIKFRYKKPDEDKSLLITEPVVFTKKDFTQTADDFRFAVAVAEFGLLLRDSQYKGTASYAHVLNTGREAKGHDENGYREEFLELVKKAEQLSVQE
ncbi:MAG: VWA domain-containing protein [Spirochaetales bacterium]|nr:VWA domain-containing protein [Spirochaetales bacterium]